MLQLWMNDDYIATFEQNISQLNPMFEEILMIQDN